MAGLRTDRTKGFCALSTLTTLFGFKIRYDGKSGVMLFAQSDIDRAFFGRPRELRTRHNMAHDIGGMNRTYEAGLLVLALADIPRRVFILKFFCICAVRFLLAVRYQPTDHSFRI